VGTVSPLAVKVWRCCGRLQPFDMKLHYTDRHRLPADVEKERT